MAIKDSNYQMKSLYLKVYVQTVMDLELFIEMLGIPSTSGEEAVHCYPEERDRKLIDIRHQLLSFCQKKIGLRISLKPIFVR